MWNVTDCSLRGYIWHTQSWYLENTRYPAAGGILGDLSPQMTTCPASLFTLICPPPLPATPSAILSSSSPQLLSPLLHPSPTADSPCLRLSTQLILSYPVAAQRPHWLKGTLLAPANLPIHCLKCLFDKGCKETLPKKPSYAWLLLPYRFMWLPSEAH